MRRSLVHSRSVRMDGSLFLGKMTLRRRPVMFVSWVSMQGDVDVSIPLYSRQLTLPASPAWPWAWPNQVVAQVGLHLSPARCVEEECQRTGRLPLCSSSRDSACG